MTRKTDSTSDDLKNGEIVSIVRMKRNRRGELVSLGFHQLNLFHRDPRRKAHRTDQGER